MSRKRLARLLEKAPVVYVGPGALKALAGGRGLLLGAQRAGWVDVLAFEPVEAKGYRALIDRRFELCNDWEVVGLALKSGEPRRWKRGLLEALVPGDVVLEIAREARRGVAYVHMGDGFTPARLRLSRSKQAT